MESPDALTPELKIDDAVLKDMLKNLYYPDSPYEFSVLPADILGQVYEQFLGKVIRLTAGHQAKVEEKPEVKKAGGVFYTPTYIVEYIVKHTVGELLKGKSPKQAEKLTILDPACGSGSFLLGAYQYLLDWYRDDYVSNHPEKWSTGRRPRLYQNQYGEWKLTIEERKRILLNNIYGVDIDSQAVEVTKLSLLLKVLEGEDEQTLSSQMSLFHKRVLPDLSNNIKCGNSLIGSDFYEGQQLLMLTEDESYRINPFDWEKEFPEITQKGGFDAVIGNPPYIRIQTLKEWAPLEVEFYKSRYASAGKGNYDIYVAFFEKGLSLLNQKGTLGFIAPHKFFNAKYGEPLRQISSAGKYLSHVVHFGHEQVFNGATTYTCLLFLDKSGKEDCRFVKVEDLTKWRHENHFTEGKISAEKITKAEWNFNIGSGTVLFERLNSIPQKLGNIAHIFVGTQTSADDVFVLNSCYWKGHDILVGMSKSLKKEVKVEASCTVPFLRGRDIRRYELPQANAYLICPYEISEGEYRLFTASEMAAKFPLAMTYLEMNKKALTEREKGRFKGENWYAFGYPKSMTLFQKPKIIVPDYNNVASFTFDTKGYFYKTGYGIILKDETLSPLYVMALLNSPVLFKYLLSIGTSLRGGYVRFWTQFLEKLPIYPVDFSDFAQKSNHDKMVELVERMLDLHKQLHAAKLPQGANSLATPD